MNKFLQRFRTLKPTRRKIIQLYTALLFNANFKGFITGNIYQGSTKKFCAPGINCYSCPGAVGACPLGSLQGSFSADKSTIYYVGGILLLYGLLFGRMICGWFCPFGFIQELFYKLKTPKLKKSPVTRILSYFKYVVLVFFVFIIPIMYAFRDTPLPTFCKYICPAGTLEGGIGLLANKVNAGYFSMLGPLFTWKFLLLVSIMVGCIFVFRLFCRFICPLGALYGFFNKISLFGVKVEKPKCTNCNLCVNRCKVDIKSVGDQECIFCGECIDVCPTKAIVWKGPVIGLKENDIPEEKTQNHKKAKLITKTVTTVLLAALLIGAVIYYWNDSPDTPTIPPEDEQQSTNNDLKTGNEVGNLCYRGELKLIDGEAIREDTIDPTKTEKITIINFWGTWCTPCVNELPYFEQIADNYGDKVSVIAIHSNMASDTAPEYIKNHYPDSSLIFAQDLENEGYYSLLGGRGTYPYTVIIDENGVIVKIFLEALHYEDLEEVVESELKGDDDISTKRGNQVGDLCYSGELNIIDGNGISESEKVSPTKTGEITVINFWGTWCTPCVNELPYFDQIATNYADEVEVIAVHSNMASDTAPEYIKNHYPETNMTFAQDLDSEGYYSLLGGRGTYPYTVIIDENGIIEKVFLEALHYEDLEEVIKGLLNK